MILKKKSITEKPKGSSFILKTDNTKIKKALKKIDYSAFRLTHKTKTNKIEITISMTEENKKIICIFSNHLNQMLTNFMEKIITNQMECEFRYTSLATNEFQIQVSETFSIVSLKKILDIFDDMHDILRKQNIYSDILELECLTETTKALLPKNRIECNYEWMCDNGFSENEVVSVYSSDFKNYKECTVKAILDIPYGKFKTYSSIKNLLSINTCNRVWIFKYNKFVFENVLTQEINKIKDNIICINKQEYQKIDKRFKAYKLIHLLSGESFIVPTTKIQPKAIGDCSIRLNYLQRKLLNLTLPSMIEHSQFDRFMNSSMISAEEKEVLKKVYDNEKIYEGGTYQEDQKILKILSKVGNKEVVLVPEVTSFEKENYFKRFLKDKIYDFFIGKSEITLKSSRPYMMDENKNIVRLSIDNMKLLGIEETDQVVIYYKGKHIKAKVLAMENLEQIKQTNIISKEADMDTMIGIPAHLRKELGIENINIAITIERDTNYLFMKNLHIQFMPLIALLFTLIQTISNLAIVILLFLVFLPIVIYIIFSEERYKVK